MSFRMPGKAGPEQTSHQTHSATKPPSMLPRGSCWLPCTTGTSHGSQCAPSAGRQSVPAGKGKTFKGPLSIFTDQTKRINWELRGNTLISNTHSLSLPSLSAQVICILRSLHFFLLTNDGKVPLVYSCYPRFPLLKWFENQMIIVIRVMAKSDLT